MRLVGGRLAMVMTISRGLCFVGVPRRLPWLRRSLVAVPEAVIGESHDISEAAAAPRPSRRRVAGAGPRARAPRVRARQEGGRVPAAVRARALRVRASRLRGRPHHAAAPAARTASRTSRRSARRATRRRRDQRHLIRGECRPRTPWPRRRPAPPTTAPRPRRARTPPTRAPAHARATWSRGSTRSSARPCARGSARGRRAAATGAAAAAAARDGGRRARRRVRVVAGPGTGKTAVLTAPPPSSRRARRARGAGGGARASELLVVTFTNRAARERARARPSARPADADAPRRHVPPRVPHDAARDIERLPPPPPPRGADAPGGAPPPRYRRGFAIYDQAASVKPRGARSPRSSAGTRRRCVDRRSRRHPFAKNSARRRAGRARGRGRRAAARGGRARFSSRVAAVFERDGDAARAQRARLRRHAPAVLLLRDGTEPHGAPIARRYRRRWRHVLVDEFQDANAPQYELLLLCAGEADGEVAEGRAGKGAPTTASRREAAAAPRSVFVVGDSDQAIYGRGADYRNQQRFDRDFGVADGDDAARGRRSRSSSTTADAAAARRRGPSCAVPRGGRAARRARARRRGRRAAAARAPPPRPTVVALRDGDVEAKRVAEPSAGCATTTRPRARPPPPRPSRGGRARRRRPAGDGDAPEADASADAADSAAGDDLGDGSIAVLYRTNAKSRAPSASSCARRAAHARARDALLRAARGEGRARTSSCSSTRPTTWRSSASSTCRHAPSARRRRDAGARARAMPTRPGDGAAAEDGAVGAPLWDASSRSRRAASARRSSRRARPGRARLPRAHVRAAPAAATPAAAITTAAASTTTTTTTSSRPPPRRARPRAAAVAAARGLRRSGYEEWLQHENADGVSAGATRASSQTSRPSTTRAAARVRLVALVQTRTCSSARRPRPAGAARRRRGGRARRRREAAHDPREQGSVVRHGFGRRPRGGPAPALPRDARRRRRGRGRERGRRREWRLHVAMTRARRRLYLCWAHQRLIWGTQRRRPVALPHELCGSHGRPLSATGACVVFVLGGCQLWMCLLIWCPSTKR